MKTITIKTGKGPYKEYTHNQFPDESHTLTAVGHDGDLEAFDENGNRLYSREAVVKLLGEFKDDLSWVHSWEPRDWLDEKEGKK